MWMDEWKNAGRNGPVQVAIGSTQIEDGRSIKEVKIRLAQAHSAKARLAYNGKQIYQFSYKD